MIVVSNTSPIFYLWEIGEIRLLPLLFKKIIIPEAVSMELCHENCPDGLKELIRNPVYWLQLQKTSEKSDEKLNRLHKGEREAILLAKQINADIIILDEKAARIIAKNKGLNVTGLLGIIDIAARKNLIDITNTIKKLNKTNFRISPSILKKLLKKNIL